MLGRILALTLSLAQDDPGSIQGLPLDSWLERLKGGYQVDPVIEELAATPEQSYPHFRDLLRGGGNQAVVAAEVLCELGEVSRRILPEIFAIVRQESHWTPDHAQRVHVIRALRRLTWAAEEATAVLEPIALDADDAAAAWATSSLVPLGTVGREALQRIVRSTKDDERRRSAEWSLGTALENEHPGARAEYFEALALADPLSADAPRYLLWATGHDRSAPHPASSEVKAALRSALEVEADVELALQLALIIQQELNGMNLLWAIPSSWGIYPTPRSDVRESYTTLREALARGLEADALGAENRVLMTTALAKIELLSGDWDAMSSALTRLGTTAPSEADLPFLTAPPPDWTELGTTWRASDPSMRNGRGRLVVRVELPDRGVPGAQVVVWKAMNARQAPGFASVGFSADTLSYEALPLDGFGYQASDRDRTRYAFTDADGRAVLEGLPAGDLRLEVMVPTATLPGDAERYSLWLKHPEQGWMSTGLGGASHGEPPLLAVAVDDQTTEYPLLSLRPHHCWSIQQWDRVDPESLVLRWKEIPGAHRYRLQMGLSTPPDGTPHSPDSAPLFRRWEVDLDQTSHDVSLLGVGEGRLAAGNVYLLSVLALAEDDSVLAEFGPTRVWTPWAHRSSPPPMASHGGYLSDAENWPENRGLFQGSNWWRDDLEELRGRLSSRGAEFEAEYARVVLAWFDWHHGRTQLARESLLPLRESLAEANAARLVAEMILEGIEAGAAPPRRLDFDEELVSLSQPPDGLRIVEGRHHLDHHGVSFLPPHGWFVYPSTRDNSVATLSRGSSELTITVSEMEPDADLEVWVQLTYGEREGLELTERIVAGRSAQVIDDGGKSRTVFLLDGRRLLRVRLRIQSEGDVADLDYLLESLEVGGDG